jgi:hypothetical protein
VNLRSQHPSPARFSRSGFATIPHQRFEATLSGVPICLSGWRSAERFSTAQSLRCRQDKSRPDTSYSVGASKSSSSPATPELCGGAQ